MQYVLIIHVDGDCTTANLLFGKFQAQHLVVWKGHLLQYDNVAVVLLEADTAVQQESRLQLYGLDIGSLLLFLILQSLYATHLYQKEDLSCSRQRSQ